MIEVHGLTKTFGEINAVGGISFEVREGEIFGLLGPNGAGKTTTVRILATLLRPDDGWAKVAEYDITQQPVQVRQSVGLLPESPAHYTRLTARENLQFFAEAYGLEREEGEERILDLLEFFGLVNAAERMVAEFSHGMRQRLALARALLHRPKILLLDEPTSGLDPKAAVEFRDLILKLAGEKEVTTFICTHNLDEAQRLCDRVGVMNKSKLVAIGSIEDLTRRFSRAGVELRLRHITDEAVRSIRQLPFAKQVVVEGRKLLVEVDDYEKNAPEVIKAAIEAGAEVLEATRAWASLWDVYLELVK